MKIMIELQIQKKRDEYFPNNLLSNYYFNIGCNNELLIFEEIDEKVGSKIVEDLASSYYFIFPLFLEPSSELGDNWKIKFITEKSMEYGGLISNHNYGPSEELEQKSGVLDILGFYKKIDLRGKRNLEEFVRHGLRFSWTYESPILVNFEEKIIVGFFEWGLKVLIYNKKKRLEVMEKYSQYMRNKE